MGDTHNRLDSNDLATRQAIALRRSGLTLQAIAIRLHLGCRQRVWQILKSAEGGCELCGQPKHPKSSARCPKHIISNREEARKRKGCTAGAVSGLGRPTIL